MEKKSLKMLDYVKGEILSHKKISFVAVIINVFAVLLLALGNSPTDANPDATYVYQNFSLIFFGVSVFLGILIVALFFRDLWSKQYSDMQLSLPLSARERFISKTLAILTVHILTIILTAVLFGLVFSVIYGSLGFLKEFLAIVFLVVDLSLFVDSVSIFCVSCCGAIAECIYTSLVMIAGISTFPILFYNKIVKVFKCVLVQNSSQPWPFKCWTLSSIYNYHDEISYKTPLFIAVGCIISLLLIFGCNFIYKKRDGKSVGKAFANKLFLYLFMFVINFTVLVMFCVTTSAILGLIILLIINLIVFLRMGLTLKRLGICLANFVACIFIFSLISFVGYCTDGFGISKIEPNEEDFANNKMSVSLYKDENNSIHWQTYAADEMYLFPASLNKKCVVDYSTTVEYYRLLTKYKKESSHSLSKWFKIMVSTNFGQEYGTDMFNSVLDSFEGSFYNMDYFIDYNNEKVLSISFLNDDKSNYIDGRGYFTATFEVSDEDYDKIITQVDLFGLKRYEFLNGKLVIKD